MTNDELKNKIKIKSIKPSKNNENVYLSNIIDENKMLQSIFDDFRLICKFDDSYAYNLLDKEYRDERYKNEEEGRKYLKEYINELLGYKIDKTLKDSSSSSYTRYICKDNYDNYFIIKKDDQSMNYSIMLDIYTIPVKEITQKYNKANNAQKVFINIEKFKQMINMKDYNSAYNVLDETFKNENFGSVEKFEKYIKNNWPEFININNKKYNEISDVGTLETIIFDRNVSLEETNEIIEKTFIIKLIDENNFVMSFNID